MDRHFDSILEDKEAEELGGSRFLCFPPGLSSVSFISLICWFLTDSKKLEFAEKETDPLKADVRTVEFLLSHKNDDVCYILFLFLFKSQVFRFSQRVFGQ